MGYSKKPEYKTTKKTSEKKDSKQSLSKQNSSKQNRLKQNVSKQNAEQQKTQKPAAQKQSASPCPVDRKCGGCQYLSMDYQKQLRMKQEMVEKLLKTFGKLDSIVGMADPYHYRNKVHAVFDRKKDGTVISGVYQEGTHIVVPVTNCLIEDEKSDAIINDIRGLLKSFKIKTYDEDTGYGLLRHVLIRRGFASGQIMVVLVLGSPILPSKNNFVKALRKLHPEITTVVLNVNDKKTSMVLGEKESVIYGKGFIEDELCGCTFRISPKSFYQVNPVQTEVLYNKAMEYAKLTGQEKVIDAYCGIGTIGMVAAKQAKEVIGIELNKDAVRDAIGNAKRNQMKNIRFVQGDATEFMVAMAERKEQADVVFMDPPRSGSTEAFLDAAVKLGPKRIVYISCNPETLARDLKYITKKGYVMKAATPVDMFPHCDHCEVVCCLSKL